MKQNSFHYKRSERKAVHSDHLQIILLLNFHSLLHPDKAFLLNIPDSFIDELINQVDNAG